MTETLNVTRELEPGGAQRLLRACTDAAARGMWRDTCRLLGGAPGAEA